MKFMNIRQPIVTVAGHVDHGKTSILDCFRGSYVQRGEEGGITQKISFTRYPFEQIKRECPLIEKQGVELEIPGFLFIDTPGHAAFTNLRKRGGSLADLAILVVDIKEGIKPQTAEVLQILKANKIPFLVALNKIDNISGWQQRGESIKESIEGQAVNVSQEFQESLLKFQASLQEHGFDSELYYDIDDFAKNIAIVPCSAKTKEGLAELLFVLCGLSQGFLKKQLKISGEAKGIIFEIKKEKDIENVEAILYDGKLKKGDEIAIASFNEPIVTKIRAIEEIEPLRPKYKKVDNVIAATGLRLHLTEKEGLVPGMPFQKVENNLGKIKKEFKKEISEVMKLDKHGIIIKADSLGSLEALITLLRQSNVKILKAGVGNVNKNDLISAKANLDINPLDAVILGFNVDIEPGLEAEIGNVKILANPVVYQLIEDLEDWRKKRQEEIERERMLGLAVICKLEILHKYMFRNSNPAIFGIKVLAGKLKTGISLIDETGEEISRVKSLQLEKESVEQAKPEQELAISLSGVNFERRLGDKKYLFPSYENNSISPERWKHIFREKILKVAGLWVAPEEGSTVTKFRSYTLRHTKATEIMNETHDLFLVANMLGHAKLNSTKVYLHKDKKYMEYMRNRMNGIKQEEKEPMVISEKIGS